MGGEIMQYMNENGIWEIQDSCHILVEPSELWLALNQPTKTQEEIDSEKLELIRLQRNRLLTESDFVIQRHIEQKELISLSVIELTTITEEKYGEWLQYRQLLRDMTLNVDLDNPLYPAKPE